MRQRRSSVAGMSRSRGSRRGETRASRMCAQVHADACRVVTLPVSGERGMTPDLRLCFTFHVTFNV